MGVCVKTLDTLTQAIEASRSEPRPTVIHLSVQPDSGSQGYDTWWRADSAEVGLSASSEAVVNQDERECPKEPITGRDRPANPA